MANKNLNKNNLGDINLEKPAELLKAMQGELTVFNNTENPTNQMVSKITLNALAKAFYKRMIESFNCSDEEVADIIEQLAPLNNYYEVTVNSVTYSYSKEQVTKLEVDKSFLASQGVKTLKAFAEKLEAEGKIIPPCIDISTKTIHSFKPDRYNGETFAKEVTSNVINITEKEIKIK